MTRLRPELLKDHSSSAGETAEVRPRWHRTAGVMMLSAALLSGCSQGGAAPAGPHAPVSAAEVHRLQQLAESCPADAAKLTQYIGIDLSSSAQDAAIEADRDKAVRALIEKVAVCSGHAHVVAFTASVAATKVLFDGDLTAGGPTDMARIRNVPAMVEATIAEIDNANDGAANNLDRTGSDITAQYGLAAESFTQMASDGVTRAWRVDLLTDGLQTVGVNLNTPQLTAATAEELASRLPIPAMPPGTLVTLSGVGKTAGSPAPTDFVDAVKAFHITYCTRSTGSVSSCRAVTDFIA